MRSLSVSWHHTVRLFMALPVLLFMAACSGQAATQPNIPVTGLSATTAAPLPAGATQPGPTQASADAPALACTGPAKLTPAVTEGPFFKAGSPERSTLVENGIAGQKLVLTGYVLTADCRPVAHALLDF